MNKIVNKIKENKGALLTAGGIMATVAGVVFMKKANLKATEIMKEHIENKNVIEECSQEVSLEEYSAEDKIRDTTINNVQTVIKLVKTYIVPATLTIAGGYATILGIRKIYNKKI